MRNSNKYSRRKLNWNKPSRKHKIPISLRPKYINNREEFGHWEGDSVTMVRSGSRVMTIVERKTKYAITIKFSSALVQENYQVLKKKILNENLVFKSITFDNGMEFNHMYKLKKELVIKIYYCHSYTPFERGTNEVWNADCLEDIFQRVQIDVQ